MAVNDAEDARHIQDIRAIQRRRLRILQEQEAAMGISVEPRILLEIEDLRKTLGILDQVERSGDNWTNGQVQLLMYTMTTANQERWKLLDRRFDQLEVGLKSYAHPMRALLMVNGALIVAVLALFVYAIWG